MMETARSKASQFFSAAGLWVFVSMIMVVRAVGYSVIWAYKQVQAIWRRIPKPACMNSYTEQQRPQHNRLSVFALYDYLFLTAVGAQLDPQEPGFSVTSIARRLRASLFSAIFFSVIVMFGIRRRFRSRRIILRIYSGLQSAVVRRVIFWISLPFLTLLLVPYILRAAIIVLTKASVRKLQSAKASLDSTVSSLKSVATRTDIWIILQQRSPDLKKRSLQTLSSLKSLFEGVVYNIKYNTLWILVGLAFLAYFIKLRLIDLENQLIETFHSLQHLLEGSMYRIKYCMVIYTIGLLVLTDRALKNMMDLKWRITSNLQNLGACLVEFNRRTIMKCLETVDYLALWVGEVWKELLDWKMCLIHLANLLLFFREFICQAIVKAILIAFASVLLPFVVCMGVWRAWLRWRGGEMPSETPFAVESLGSVISSKEIYGSQHPRGGELTGSATCSLFANDLARVDVTRSSTLQMDGWDYAQDEVMSASCLDYQVMASTRKSNMEELNQGLRELWDLLFRKDSCRVDSPLKAFVSLMHNRVRAHSF